jgi:hypothetical protein
MQQRLAAAIVWGAVLCGAAGAAVALHTRGSEEVFRYEQSRSLTLKPVTVLSAAHVQAVVAQAPEPVAAAQRTRPIHVLCRPRGAGVLRNPWSCTIIYRSGTVAQYRVLVRPDGHYSGTGPGIISGCCVQTPTLD